MSNQVQLEGIMQKGYGIMPKYIMKDKDLDIEAKGIYAYLVSYSGRGKSSFPSVSLMCEDLQISENRFYKYRKQLTENGYVTIKKSRKNGKRDNNIYILNLHPQKQHLQNEGIENEGIEFEGANNNSSNNNSSNNNNTNINISSKDSCYLDGNDWPTPSELPRNNQNHRIYPKEFEDLYDVYPDRPNEDKGKAYKKVRARINEGIDYIDLGKAAMNYRKYCDIEDKIGTKYVKMMSTFFGESDPWVEFQEYDFDKIEDKESQGLDQLKEIYAEL